MTIDRCPKCRGFIFADDSHRCPPEWRVWMDDGFRKDGSCFHADSAEQAAIKFVEDYDSCDHEIAAGREDATVYVAPANSKDASAQKFVVSGETVAHYHAKEV